jgi:dTDP-L-rhamnose 4-epimerase
MRKKVLITGGAGFIGSHLADELLAHDYDVRALDSLAIQVHGPDGRRPDYLHPQVELLVGDVRDPEAVRLALEGVDIVYHFAAAVGVGQSMYQIAKYTSVNNVGTAVLLEAISQRPVEKLIVASSMSIYGEGLYLTSAGQLRSDVARTARQLDGRQWDPLDDKGAPMKPLPTPEGKFPSIASVYALSKYDQERMCLMVGAAHRIPTVALRFFNVYGPRQALSNPYTGVLAIFACRLLNDSPPMIFEDGLQQRDFVSVRDVARACRLALEVKEAADVAINIGSGRQYTVLQIARELSGVLGRSIQPEVTGQYRVGDIRHCFGDITLAEDLLGFHPQVEFGDGLRELAEWLVGQQAMDNVHKARHELEMRGLTV